MEKVKCAVIGTGNIGCDLMVKIQRSSHLVCSMMAGRNMDSAGSQFAVRNGIRVSDRSIDAIAENPDCCDIVIDATSAAVHRRNAPIFKKMGKFTLDMTPAKVGIMCVPVINLEEALTHDNVNFVTCGGQASIPIAYAISRVHPEIRYIEIVSTIASKSAGTGTRDNIDEFTQTTKEALSYFTGVTHTKALITLNPAHPPIHMHTTIYALIEKPDMEKIKRQVDEMAGYVRKYVPGYTVLVEPVFDGNRVTTTVGVTGLGDYLPPYAGNLDIITCAAVEVAQAYAQRKNRER